MPQKKIKKSEPSYLNQVKKLLPKGDTFHYQRGPIIWITRRHIEKIEEVLRQLDQMKYINVQNEKKNHLITQKAREFLKIISSKN